MPEPILFGLVAVGLLSGSLVHTLVDWRSVLPFVGDPDGDDDDADDDDHDTDDRDDPDEDNEDRD
ncbi:hypothetical protein [Halococcus saccharolyticus]|nr:hypothetical protein [Halococcus saccharolyticus]